jgi:hypothetical protein
VGCDAPADRCCTRVDLAVVLAAARISDGLAVDAPAGERVATAFTELSPAI